MSEYWKSTPKYWCKHCKTHVRDTPLERRNHESTPKHQGNISRFLRDLHRANERESRDAQRAKDEAARLNGPGGLSAGAPSVAGQPAPLKSSGAGQAKATPEDRKRQLAQLAALGVAVPDEFRRENAMAGEWESVGARPAMPLGARRPLGGRVKVESEEGVKKEEGDTGLETIAAEADDRKRPADDDAEGIGFSFKGKKKPKWGEDVKAYKDGDDGELDALLESTTTVRKETKQDSKAVPAAADQDPATGAEMPVVKHEDDTGTKVTGIPSVPEADEATPTTETELGEEDLDVESIFKKRKPKLKR